MLQDHYLGVRIGVSGLSTDLGVHWGLYGLYMGGWLGILYGGALL